MASQVTVGRQAKQGAGQRFHNDLACTPRSYVLTVVLSWTLVNTVYTLRYAHQHFRSKPGGIAFGTAANKSSYKRRRAGTLPRGRVTLSR